MSLSHRFFAPFLLLAFVFLCEPGYAQAQETVVSGTVLDVESGEPLPFANVTFTGTTIGTTTDMDGNFGLKTNDLGLTSISVSFLGFETKTFEVEPGKEQSIVAKIGEDNKMLQAVEVKRKRKTPKDTLAVRLYRRVVDNRDNNRPDGYDSYKYEEYVKTEFDVFNVKEKFTKRKVFKPFEFIFENMDTTQEGVAYLPALLKERITDVYFTKSPEKSKEVIKADRFSGVEDFNLSDLVDYTFDDVDVYGNMIEVGGIGFLSPFAGGALMSYKYFLTDSAFLDNQWCYKLEFTPRRKQDLCFTGFAWIHDETAAIKNIEMYLLNQVNLNYVSNFAVRQGFGYIGGQHWLKDFEQMEVNLNLTKKDKNKSIRILKSATRNGIEINGPIASDIFSGDGVAIDKDARERDNAYWKANRHSALTQTEERIYEMVDRVKETKTFKAYEWLGHFGSSGYMRAGPVELGRAYQFYSWNALEGKRVRFGFRTNRKWTNDKYQLEGYAAYGTKDKLFKYHAGLRVNLTRENHKWNQIGGYYRYDWSDYNVRNSYMTHDHILASLLRKKPLDNLFLIRQGHVFYDREWVKGFSTKLNLTHKTIYSWPGAYDFTDASGAQLDSEQDNFSTFEIGFGAEWGIGQKFLESGMERRIIDFSAPVLGLSYKTSLKGVLGSDYGYHQVGVTLKQRINSRLGRTDYEVEGGKIFGNVPYPLLKVHKGNESYMFNRHLYNAMNDFEYVNDMWASATFRHQFKGLIFNAIPGVRKLKLRSLVYAKALVGTMSDANKRYLDSSNGLKSLDGFYAETGIGIENILKLGELHFVWRLTQRKDPTVPHFALKFYISPSF